MRTDNQHQQPTLAEVIQTAIDANLINLHVCLPAKIVKYDSDSQTATVLPSLMKLNENDDIPYPWAPIPNVPVIWPRASAGLAYFHMPLLPSDDVTLIVSERSLDNWKEKGILVDPDDRRRHNMTDCFAIPGGSAEPLAFEVDDKQAVEIGYLESLIQMKIDGTINVKNAVGEIAVSPAGKIEASNEVGSVSISETGEVDIDGGTGATHGVGLGDNIENRLTALENEWTTFITSYNLHMHPTAAPGPPSPPLVPATPFVAVPLPAASQTAKVST